MRRLVLLLLVNLGLIWYSTKAASNMMIKCLASEEPDITVMAVKPGIVDTDMSASVFTRGKGHVDMTKFKFLKEAKKLRPEEPAEVLAELVLEAPMEYTGKFFSFNNLP